MKTPTANKTEIPTKPSKRNSFAFRARRDWQRNWELYVIIIPVLIYFILFQYKPMYGALIAFKNLLNLFLLRYERHWDFSVVRGSAWTILPAFSQARSLGVLSATRCC